MMQVVMGASSRLELHLYADTQRPHEDLTFWKDIDAIADQRLRRRLVLSYRGDPSHDLRELAKAFRGTGWVVRAYPQLFEAHPLEFLVVDREVAWVGGGNQSSHQMNRYILDGATIEGLVAEYRQLWALAVPADGDLLYAVQPPIALVPPKAWWELIEELEKHPERLHELDPRRFEELVAELLLRLGYTVTLTPASRDGGRDLLLASPTEVGDFLYIVECKRYAPDRLVGVQLVRQLYGVVEAERVTAGILVTTSGFTQPAWRFQGSVGTRLSLKDYENLKTWLRIVRGTTPG